MLGGSGCLACFSTMHPPGFGECENHNRGRPGKDGRKGKRPKSLGQLLGKTRWEKPLAGLIMATGVGLLGQGRWDGEMGRVERNDGWRRVPFI
jgi:hypothetical protein